MFDFICFADDTTLSSGYENEKIFKLQKKAIRIISLAKYNAHTEPLFKTLNLLKINDISI